MSVVCATCGRSTYVTLFCVRRLSNWFNIYFFSLNYDLVVNICCTTLCQSGSVVCLLMKRSSTPISSPASKFQAVDINEDLASRNSTLNDTVMVHSGIENSEPKNPSTTGKQLKKGNLNATEVFRAVINTENLIHEQIPSGTKENIYLLLDNTKKRIAPADRKI